MTVTDLWVSQEAARNDCHPVMAVTRCWVSLGVGYLTSKGVGAPASKARSAGLEVSGIQDKTPIAHNGCRLSKRRRV